MQALPNNYLLEIARQLAFLSAFLGGFAATFLVTLLTLKSEKPIATWTIATSAVSACILIVAVVAAVMLSVILQPDAPAHIADDSAIMKGRVFTSLGFAIGILSLLASVGLSGWIRSKRTGIVTSAIAAVSFVAVMSVIGRVG